MCVGGCGRVGMGTFPGSQSVYLHIYFSKGGDDVGGGRRREEAGKSLSVKDLYILVVSDPSKH